MVVSNTEITAVSPPVGSTGTFYIQVVTLGGKSTATTADFVYSALPPLIINITPASGGPSSSPAVTEIAISGENFLIGSTTVSFYPISDWNQSTQQWSSNNGRVDASVSVTSPTALTVTLPTGANGLVKGTTYYPEISANGLDSQPYNEPADQFDYTG